jgi:hypothetical protein
MLAIFGSCVLEEVDNPEYSDLFPPYRIFCAEMYNIVWRKIGKGYREAFHCLEKEDAQLTESIQSAYKENLLHHLFELTRY